MAKLKIPKRVGGVKIPKKLRRKAKKALRIVESPELRDAAAAALLAIAQGLTTPPREPGRNRR